MTVRLEHANLCVRDVDAMIRFLQTAFPEFHIRRDQIGADGERWVHIGSDDTYLTLNPAREMPEQAWKPYEGYPGVNHLGFQVDDAAGLRERMRAAGYEDSTVPNAHPHRTRVYFHDSEGNDWEFVEYHSENRDERNDYELG